MIERWLRFLALALAALIALTGASPPAGPQTLLLPAREPATTRFNKDVVPFLARHFYSCHGNGNGKNRGDLTLDKSQDEESLVQDRDVWEHVVEMVRTGEMPPKAKTKGERFENCVRLALEGALVWPAFLFRVELDPPGAKPGTSDLVGEYDLASRLSHFLWSSIDRLGDSTGVLQRLS